MPRRSTVSACAALALTLALLTGCSSDAPADDLPPDGLAGVPWDSVVAKARGQTVDWLRWSGDPLVNAYVEDYVAPILRDSFGVTLRSTPGQGGEIVTALMGELEAGSRASAYDLVWINGETFYQLRQIDALWGPFADDLPTARYVDYDNPFIGRDFQQPTDGYEAAWGNVQMTLIYDTTRVANPPTTRAELYRWARANPGRLTWDAHFTGMGFLKSLLVDAAGGLQALEGPFREAAYERASDRLFAYVDSLKPYLWKGGETFPADLQQLHQLYAGGEVDFTMSYNDSEADNKVAQGLFPPTTRAYVPRWGLIQNSHYLGIPRLARDKAGALVAIALMQSPAAQLRKLDPAVWGDGTVLDRDALPPEWQQRFADAPGRERAPARADIESLAIPELAPEYTIRLERDFRARILER
jgi:putative spermidine/putrescine transport system substrate-binding protein